MNFIHKTKLILAMVLLVLTGGPVSAQTNARSRKPAHTFGWQGEHFLLDGKPFQIISGDMHYARVPARIGGTG
jgi:beta-galactosidase